MIAFLHRRVLTVQDESVDLISRPRDANRVHSVYKLLGKKFYNYQRHVHVATIVVGIDVDSLLICDRAGSKRLSATALERFGFLQSHVMPHVSRASRAIRPVPTPLLFLRF